MQDTNVVSITAYLTRDPELRNTRGGTSVCDLRVAIGRRAGKDGEDRGAAFIDVRTWGMTADLCAKYLAKGRHISVVGRIEHDEWTHKGSKYQRVYVVADHVLFLGGAPERATGSDDAEPEPAAPAADVEPESAAAAA